MLILLKSGIFEQKPQDSKKEIIFVPLCWKPDSDNNSKNAALEKSKNQNWSKFEERHERLQIERSARVSAADQLSYFVSLRYVFIEKLRNYLGMFPT